MPHCQLSTISLSGVKQNEAAHKNKLLLWNQKITQLKPVVIVDLVNLAQTDAKKGILLVWVGCGVHCERP